MKDVATPELVIEHLSPRPDPLGWDDTVPTDAPCPPALHEWLFGGDPALGSYAIVDAGRVKGLANMLETSGLQHASLFDGQAAVDLGDAGPWLVALEPEQRFVRKLTLAAPRAVAIRPPWAMWSASAALFLRSGLNFDALRRHLRRFHLVALEGQRTFFRFWDALNFEDSMIAYGPAGLNGLFTRVDSVVVYHSRAATRLRCDSAVQSGPISIEAEHRSHYRSLRQQRLTDAVTEHFMTLPEFVDEDYEAFRPRVEKYLNQARHIGLRDAADLHQVALGLALSRDEPEFRSKLRDLYDDEAQNMVRRRAQILELIQSRIDVAKAASQQGAA